MQIVVVGLNHRTAPLALRERLAFTASQIALQITQHIEQTVHTNASLQHSGFHFKELAWLSTCNRTELYGVMSTPQNVDTLAQFFANSHKISSSELKPHLYVLFEQHAIRHVFRVASGLDSMILGEPQILGQIKEAMRIAHAAKGLGSVLQQLFQRSFTSAKQVRSQTAINAHHISHAAITVQLAEQIFGDLQQRSVLFIGAGEMIELCATHFKARHPKQMVIANRSMAKAQKLADRFSAQTLTLAQLSQELSQFDIVISCTASTLPIIGLGLMQRVIKERRHQPICVVDLAVPRDVEAEVEQLSDVFLYTIDDLGQFAKQALNERESAALQAEAMIDMAVCEFMNWLDFRKHLPFLQNLEMQTELLYQRELQRAQKMLAQGIDASEVLKQFARRLFTKTLHAPRTALRKSDIKERQHIMPGLSQLLKSKT